jgi:ADP-ribose pyrophosphatase
MSREYLETGAAALDPDGPRPDVLGSHEVFAGNVINVRVDKIELSGGRKATREVVEYPGAVVVIALTETGEVTLVRQYRYAIGRYLLEFPAGALEKGEDPLVSAQRELREEAGLEAAAWTSLGSFFSSPGFANEILHVFLAEGLRPGHADTDEDEDIQVVRYKVNELYDHPEYIHDAKTLAALVLLQKARSGVVHTR